MACGQCWRVERRKRKKGSQGKNSKHVDWNWSVAVVIESERDLKPREQESRDAENEVHAVEGRPRSAVRSEVCVRPVAQSGLNEYKR